jgi:hypothetical protein
MARPSASPSIRPAQLTPTQMHLGIERLNKVIARIEQFEPRTVTDQFNTPALDGLKAAIDDALVQTFSADTLDFERYKPAADFYCGPYDAAFATPAYEIQKSIAQSKGRSLALLREAVKALENTESTTTKALVTKIGQETLGARSRKVFVVHGHDEGAREAVARFLEAYHPARTGQQRAHGYRESGGTRRRWFRRCPPYARRRGVRKGRGACAPSTPKCYIRARLFHWPTRT